MLMKGAANREVKELLHRAQTLEQQLLGGATVGDEHKACKGCCT